MITLPSLAGIPPLLAPELSDPLAAQCALALSRSGEIAAPKGRGRIPLEHAALRAELASWLDQAGRKLRFIRPSVHVSLGMAPTCACTADVDAPIGVWVGSVGGEPWDSRWSLEPRWVTIERTAPGLAQTALDVLGRGLWDVAFPLFTPMHALGMAQWTYWMGEDDETEVLAEYHSMDDSEGKVADDSHIIRRALIDKQMPVCASESRRVLKTPALERLERRRGPVGEIARRVLMLQHEDRLKRRFELHRQDEDDDQVYALGYAATLRWNARDPMGRIFDDHAQYLFEGSHDVSHSWGWFVLKEPRQMRALLDELENRLANAVVVEQLLELIAARSYS